MAIVLNSWVHCAFGIAWKIEFVLLVTIKSYFLCDVDEGVVDRYDDSDDDDDDGCGDDDGDDGNVEEARSGIRG